jgi:WD40 repeat protein
VAVAFFPRGDRLASVDRAGEIRLWSLAEGAPGLLRVLQGPGAPGQTLILPFDSQTSYLAKDATESSAYLWDLDDPPNAEPVMLKRPDPLYFLSGAFDPVGDWLLTGNGSTVAFWPLSSPRARVLGDQRSSWAMVFTPDSRWLATCPMREPARLVPLDPADGAARTLVPREPCWCIAAHPAGTHVLVGTNTGKLLLWPVAGGQPRRLLERWETQAGTSPVTFDVQGRRAIAGPMDFAGGLTDPQNRVLRVWDLGTAEEHVFSVAHLTGASWHGFETIQLTPDGQLFVAGQGGIHRLVLPPDPSGRVSSETVYATGSARSSLSPDGRYLLVRGNRDARAEHFDELLLFDLAEGTSRRITTHGHRLFEATFDATGRVIVTGDIDGVVRAGPVTGEEPHLLLGYTGPVTALAVSPDGRWVAAGGDRPVHLWPLPDVTRPPLHTLPPAELMARLDALTNLRVVADPASSTGWQLDIGPFPGWATVPSW